MVTLCIDTSTASSLIGVFTADRSVFRKLETVQTGSHSEELPNAVNELFAEINQAPSNLSKIIYGIGPGSFTGLRIGASFCAGLFMGSSVEDYCVIGIPSFEIFAAGILKYSDNNKVGIYSDARRDEHFGLELQWSSPEHLSFTVIKELSLYPNSALGIGDGWRPADSITATEFESGIRFLLSLTERQYPLYNKQSIPQLELLYVREAAARTIAQRQIAVDTEGSS